MDETAHGMINTEIAEIERLIKEFKEKFEAGTACGDDFMTISQLELMWSELQNKTNNIFSDMIRKLISEVDESDFIRKKIACTNKPVQTKRSNPQNTH